MIGAAIASAHAVIDMASGPINPPPAIYAPPSVALRYIFSFPCLDRSDIRPTASWARRLRSEQSRETVDSQPDHPDLQERFQKALHGGRLQGYRKELVGQALDRQY